MAIDLADYVESLKREVSPPGSNPWGNTQDEVWTGYLSDAFWEARLDGFLTSWACDVDGIVVPLDASTGDIGRDNIALIIVYAGHKVLRNKIAHLNTVFRAEAGSVAYETQQSASVLTELLKELDAIKERLRDAEHGDTTDYLFDAYAIRELAPTYAGHLASTYSALGA